MLGREGPREIYITGDRLAFGKLESLEVIRHFRASREQLQERGGVPNAACLIPLARVCIEYWDQLRPEDVQNQA